MPGLFGLLEIGRRGLSAQQLSMNVTSQNIANATTPGYTRQRADLVSTMPLQNAQGLFIGTGVDVASISRLRNQLLDSQFRQTNGSLGSASMRQGILSQIETGLGEPGDQGLQTAMTEFFNSFQALSAHPEDTASRNAVLAQANQLVATFHRISTTFTDQRANIVTDTANKVTQINSLTQQIAQLNQQIVSVRGAGGQPNELMDQRDQIIDQLSQLTNVTALQDSTGIVNVSIGGVLVAGNGTSQTLQSNIAGGSLKIMTADGKEVPVSGGQLGGMMELYNTTIPGYMAKLDDLAATLVSRVNTVHAAGYGQGNPPPTGLNFFSGTDAATISIDPAIASNAANIAASGDGTPGNNANALALFGIMNEQLMNGGTTTVSQYYSSFVSSIGSDVVLSTSASDGAQLYLTQVDGQRQSVSGVSIDEEMTNMIKFQRSFDAAARVITTADQLMQTILNMGA